MQGHADMEACTATGKLVVTTRNPPTEAERRPMRRQPDDTAAGYPDEQDIANCPIGYRDVAEGTARSVSAAAGPLVVPPEWFKPEASRFYGSVGKRDRRRHPPSFRPWLSRLSRHLVELV